MNNPNSQSYNLGWRNHSNFSWKDQGNQGSSSKPFNPLGFQPRPQGVVQHPETKPSWELAIEKLANVTLERIERMETKVDQLTTYNRNLEIQMGQLANAFNSKGQDNFPSKTEINPKEQCKVITLRSGKQLGQVSKEVVASDGEEVAHEEVTEENETEKTEHNETQSQPPLEVTPYVPPIPFPQRLKTK
ncbi:hypothetical protein NE237_019643 [Protea cynaroides]|uniref:Uncharacterized protein n=1 Tax=Protea cynaroides TaxID=273540 RepID=A0A9Q0K350_9MAGN|nr:hypothetical protein NE237_019643 [Protea cynaroides]